MKRPADFRSDTVTRPSPAMRKAMAEAEVGDDVFQDDPTVKELERRGADVFGHEASLFVPSGTMGNLIALKAHTKPGDEAIVESLSHTFNSEGGGGAWIAGVQLRTVFGPRGVLDPAEVARFARPGSEHSPRTALVAVENTHNFYGGCVVPIENLRALRRLADERGMKFHIDGARIFNAHVASGTPLRDYGALAHSIMFCLSKGLGAPIGSLLTGTRAFIAEARRVRKALGGGMRQVGVIAAAGLVALDEGPRELARDHENARALASGMREIPGAVIDPDDFPTNIIFLRTEAGPASYAKIQAALEREQVLAIAVGELGVRFCTHRDVNEQDVARALEVLARVVPEVGRATAGRGAS